MIALAADTAILFDHKSGQAKAVQYDGQLDSLYKMLGVDMIDTIRVDRDHVIFVDDEGFYKQYKTGFQIMYKGKKTQFVGSGLLVGDKYGSNAPITLEFGDLKIDALNVTYETREETTGEEKGV